MSIGEALADARRQAGLTVSCLSDRAHVREAIITDIEGDDYSACGGGSYARGYIRIIAQAVGAGLLRSHGPGVRHGPAGAAVGPAHGASFQVRAGAAPALADLPPVAQAASTGGVVHLRLPTPAHGRYLLIWFTSLPPDPAGTFQASVYDVRLEGQA